MFGLKLAFNCSINAQKSVNCLPEKIKFPKLDALLANILFVSRFWSSYISREGHTKISEKFAISLADKAKPEAEIQ